MDKLIMHEICRLPDFSRINNMLNIEKNDFLIAGRGGIIIANSIDTRQ
jgi:hypothetical protein